MRKRNYTSKSVTLFLLAFSMFLNKKQCRRREPEIAQNRFRTGARRKRSFSLRWSKHDAIADKQTHDNKPEIIRTNNCTYVCARARSTKMSFVFANVVCFILRFRVSKKHCNTIHVLMTFMLANDNTRQSTTLGL